MQALETFPPFNRNREKAPEATETNDEYAHVKQYNSPRKGRKCGTLSKSEWEAACKRYFIPAKFFIYDETRHVHNT